MKYAAYVEEITWLAISPPPSWKAESLAAMTNGLTLTARMIKTEMQIERDFYSFVKNSDLGKAIKGKVYRPEMRPANATTEDLIVKFAGLDANSAVQTGVVIFNLYVPDIPHADGRMVPDKNRIGKLEELLLAFVETAGTEYVENRYDTDDDAQREIEQHCHTQESSLTA